MYVISVVGELLQTSVDDNVFKGSNSAQEDLRMVGNAKRGVKSQKEGEISYLGESALGGSNVINQQLDVSIREDGLLTVLGRVRHVDDDDDRIMLGS
jgi:hypothetical protein